MANTAGGHIVYGMREDQSSAAELVGLEIADPGMEQRRLEELLQRNIQPPIIGVRVQPIILSSNRFAIVIRIPQSWSGPHRTDFQGSRRFYARNSSAAYEPDVQELRQMFMTASTTSQKVREMHEKRVADVRRGNAPVFFNASAALLLHIFPRSSIYGDSQIDAKLAHSISVDFPPARAGEMSRRYNYDGVTLFGLGARRDDPVPWYLQIFRSGLLEFGWSDLVEADDPRSYFSTGLTESTIIGSLPNFFALLSRLSVNPPYVVSASLSGMRHSYPWLPSGRVPSGYYRCDRDEISLPPILFETATLEGDWQIIYKPALDVMWNAFGLSESPFFTQDQWRERG